MEGEIWDFGDIFNTSDCQFICSAGKSGDSLVKFSDVSPTTTLQKETLMIS